MVPAAQVGGRTRRSRYPRFRLCCIHDQCILPYSSREIHRIRHGCHRVWAYATAPLYAFAGSSDLQRADSFGQAVVTGASTRYVCDPTFLHAFILILHCQLINTLMHQ
ncbi:hypothetical protein FKP32DRAFT_1759401 [Trametes sanguinea]|nr:hypothetical protein FKP32DRAFT_1759401 [Trametes sanguinea]